MSSNPVIQHNIANWRETPSSTPFDPLDVRFRTPDIRPEYLPLIQPKQPMNKYGLRVISQRILGVDAEERWVEDNPAEGKASATYITLEGCLRGARFPFSLVHQASLRYPDIGEMLWNEREIQAVAEKYLLHWRRMLATEGYPDFPAQSSPALLPLLPMDDVGVAPVLGLLELPDTVAALFSGLNSPTALLRREAAHGLAQTMPRHEVEQHLLGHIHDPAPGVRAEIAVALGCVGSEQSLDTLLALLGDIAPVVRQEAINGLICLGLPQARDPIRALIFAQGGKDTSGEVDLVRMSAILALRTFWTEEDMALLQEITLHDTSPVARSTAVFVLGQQQREEALGELRRALRDASPLVRGAAAQALAALDDVASIPRLVELAQSDVPHFVDPLSGQYESETTFAIDALVGLARRGHSNARSALKSLGLDMISLG